MKPKQLDFEGVFLAASQREKLTADLDFNYHLRNPAYAKYRGQVDVSYLATVMLHIGRFPESYQRQEIICRTLKLPKRKLQRVIATLKALDILVTVRKHLAEGRSGGTNHHRINWEEVRRLVERQSQPFDLSDKRDALNARSLDDLGDKRVATYPTNEHDLGDKRVATYPTSVSPSLIERNLEGTKGDEKNTSPPNPPLSEASKADQCQEEQESFVSNRTESRRTVDSSSPADGDGRSLGSSIQKPPQALSQALARRPADLDSEADSLERLIADFLAFGVSSKDEVRAAAYRTSIEHVRMLLQLAQLNEGRFMNPAGALFKRLGRAELELPPEKGWPGSGELRLPMRADLSSTAASTKTEERTAFYRALDQLVEEYRHTEDVRCLFEELRCADCGRDVRHKLRGQKLQGQELEAASEKELLRIAVFRLHGSELKAEACP